MTIIEKELAYASAEIAGFIGVRNIYYGEVGKLKQIRAAELLKVNPSQKMIAVLDSEIKERENAFNVFLARAVEMLHYRDRLNGVYQKIVKPYGFSWRSTDSVMNFWSPKKFKVSNTAYSQVGNPFTVKRVNLLSNILPLPFDQAAYNRIGTGYILPIRISDNNGLQAMTEVLKYNDVEITVEEKLTGQLFDVSVMGVNKPNLAESDGLYITSIAGNSIDGFQNDSEDPGDEGNTGIVLHFTAITEIHNFPYIFPHQTFKADGIVATQLYSWLPNAKYIF
jgi:hypothetical protein